MSATRTEFVSHANQLPMLNDLPVEHILDMHVDLEPAQVVATTFGLRMTMVAKGGRISGPNLSGEILPGGGDWLLVGSDMVGRVDVRATLRTDDGALIHFETRGLIKLPTDGLQRLGNGEVLPFEQTYVRTTPKFETADERYAWLSEVVCVAYNILSPDHIDYRIYKVL